MKKKGRLYKHEGSIRFMKIFPWFVLGFLAASLVRTIGILPPASYSVLNDLGKFGICTAMVAIGLNTKPMELHPERHAPYSSRLGLLGRCGASLPSRSRRRDLNLVRLA